MTKLLPLLFLSACGLTGCAGWVVFGHTIGAKEQTASSPAVAPAAAPASAVPGNAAQPSPSITDPPSAVAPVSAAATPPTLSRARLGEAPPQTPVVKAVTLTLTSQAAEKAGSDPRFKQGKLLDALEHTLRARKLLDENDPAASGSLEVSIEDFATRAATNAVVLGYNLGTGTLVGDVTIRDAAGKTVRSFPIRAHSRLATLASDDTASASGDRATSGLGPLYHRFAKLAANGVAGTEEKPDYAADNKEIPR